MNCQENPEFHSGWMNEIRRGKLASLKQAVTEGNYKVSAPEVAEKVLKEWLWDLALTLSDGENRRDRNDGSVA
jgi:hypothetical protein